ncbi:TrmB family transcriptional regulator [Rhizobium sp. P32RR-XVIII]|uniref:helix-turn-helix domain-containing protein n=1 Tax=Rhizobium sp. P32RR-XVIII TaxID=2726738 RepID=UPI001456D829|nr:helix-turn-helix domain-containing protein [Rhizobium sp. P32RR-XVIII]NLS07191.1 TrmB family transcriptional regulator [Rhizobium sp. P32RR-XVIII]
MAPRGSITLDSFAFSALASRMILDDRLPDETAQARLKQIGMLNVLQYMLELGRELTVSAIVTETGLTRTGVNEVLEPLVRKGLLVERVGTNAMGRGKARFFEISPALLPSPS